MKIQQKWRSIRRHLAYLVAAPWKVPALRAPLKLPPREGRVPFLSDSAEHQFERPRRFEKHRHPTMKPFTRRSRPFRKREVTELTNRRAPTHHHKNRKSPSN